MLKSSLIFEEFNQALAASSKANLEAQDTLKKMGLIKLAGADDDNLYF